MTAKWTRRRSGGIYTTIRVAYEIPKTMVDWMYERGLTETTAMAWIRDHVQHLADGWKTVAWDPQHNDFYIVHVDDAAREAQDGKDVYEGDPVV